MITRGRALVLDTYTANVGHLQWDVPCQTKMATEAAISDDSLCRC